MAKASNSPITADLWTDSTDYTPLSRVEPPSTPSLAVVSTRIFSPRWTSERNADLSTL